MWAITKGSIINKLIVVTVTLLLNLFFPAAIIAVLVLGGFYLACEGVEKIEEYFFLKKQAAHSAAVGAALEDATLEKAKIKSAVATAFILPVEIIIALRTVLDKSTGVKILTVSAVHFIATVGVYSLVALIVRIDDSGLLLIIKSNQKGFLHARGLFWLKARPLVITSFAVIGTVVLLLVSGGIFYHNIDFLYHAFPE